MKHLSRLAVPALLAIGTAMFFGAVAYLVAAHGRPERASSTSDGPPRSAHDAWSFSDLLFDTSAFPARWHCGQWSALDGWFYISAGAAVGLAYVFIPSLLFVLRRARPDLLPRGLTLLFVAFILCCGATHFLDVMMFWQPMYRVGGVTLFLTALVSWATVLTLIQRRGEFLQLRSPAELERQVALRTSDLEAQKLVLEQTTRAAEEANAAKSRFLSTMSHEFRTPLTAIKGYVEELQLLDQRGGLPQAAREGVTTIASSAGHLLQLINDCLDLGKIEAGRLELCLGVVSTEELHARLQAGVVRAAELRGNSVQLRPLHGFPERFTSDAQRLSQVLLNLLSNAVKFTERGSIDVTAELRGSRLVWTVTDCGIGIPKDRHTAVFEEFVQAENSTTRRFGGTGLGLTISKRLATLMGGSLELVRSEPGKGTVMRLEVPFIEAPREAEATPAHAEGAPQLQGLRVLVAEDNPVNQRLVRLILERMGCEVDIVADGRQVLAAFESAPARYEAILLDQHMPVMDGVEAARELRQRGWQGPLIALTAAALEADRSAMASAGCDRHLEKPIHRALLQATLFELCRTPASP